MRCIICWNQMIEKEENGKIIYECPKCKTKKQEDFKINIPINNKGILLTLDFIIDDLYKNNNNFCIVIPNKFKEEMKDYIAVELESYCTGYYKHKMFVIIKNSNNILPNDHIIIIQNN